MFFQSRRDLGVYFKQVVRSMSIDAELYRGRVGKFSVSAFFNISNDQFLDAIDFKRVEKRYTKGGGLSKWQEFFYFLKSRFIYALDYYYLKTVSPDLVVVWNGLKYRQSIFLIAAKNLKVKACFMENGLLPSTTVCDFQGVNAGNSLPRLASFYKELGLYSGFSQRDLVVRKACKQRILSEKDLPERYIFVPFQVDSDSQIIKYSPWIKNMRQLVECSVEAAKGNVTLVFKEHPSSPVNYDYLHDALDSNVAVFANHMSTQALIEGAEAVITINSTIGIESLGYAKKVIVLGQAFYAIDGLVKVAKNVDQLEDMINSIGEFVVDDALRLSFLSYLQTEYLIDGDWREPTEEHLKSVVSRIMSGLS